jgi:ribose/xylose/arabinose/galactoside ABC-type transport system permease subunit
MQTTQVRHIQRFQTRELLRRYGLVLVFLLLCAVLALLSDRFLTVSNLVNVLRQFTIDGILSNGLNLVGVTSCYQQVIKGLVFILAVSLDMWGKRRK